MVFVEMLNGIPVFDGSPLEILAAQLRSKPPIPLVLAETPDGLRFHARWR